MRILIPDAGLFNYRIVNAVKSMSPNHEVIVVGTELYGLRQHKPDHYIKIPSTAWNPKIHCALLDRYMDHNEVDLIFPTSGSEAFRWSLPILNEKYARPGITKASMALVDEFDGSEPGRQNLLVIGSVHNSTVMHMLLDVSMRGALRIGYSWPSQYKNDYWRIESLFSKIVDQLMITSGVVSMYLTRINGEYHIVGVKQTIPGPVLELMSHACKFPTEYIRSLLGHVLYDLELSCEPTIPSHIGFIPIPSGTLDKTQHPKRLRDVRSIIQIAKPGDALCNIDREEHLDQRGWIVARGNSAHSARALYYSFIGGMTYTMS